MASDKISEYDFKLKHTQYAAEQLWHLFEIFILANTILIGFLGVNLSQLDHARKYGFINNFYLILILGLGVFMSLIWLSAYLRTRGYHDFRLAQANASEPEEWKLLREDGKNFAKGKTVIIGEECFRMPLLARILKIKNTMPVFIDLFLLFYTILLLNTLGLSLISSMMAGIVIAIIVYLIAQL